MKKIMTALAAALVALAAAAPAFAQDNVLRMTTMSPGGSRGVGAAGSGATSAVIEPQRIRLAAGEVLSERAS